MINTNDGYYWAEGARDILSADQNINKNSPATSVISQLTALIAKIVPFSFETIIFFMPAFFASFIVIPIILIGRSLGKVEVGFIASLLASIAWSYYNRTMIGYYDTDFLNIVFPTILLWSLILALRTQEEKYLFFTALDIIAYRWWYPQSYSLEFAFIGLIFLYIFYQYIKKENSSYTFILITFMLFAMINLDGYLRFGIVGVLWLLLKFKKEIFLKYLYYLFGVSLVLFFITGGFEPILGQLKGYVFKEHIQIVGEELQLHYYTVMQTIREASSIPFETFANRISGHIITFIIGLLGYVWLIVRYPIMLLGLPMLGLGFLAYSSGLRFTIYAVPIIAFGVSFFIFEMASFIQNKIKRNSVIVLLSILVLVPNINHILTYRVPTVFIKSEVEVLDRLKKIASRDDYVVSWWDYGYPIRYYSDTKTLSDGGKHSGAVNFPTSFALTNSQKEAANILRLDVEYTENIDQNTLNSRTNIANMSLDYGFIDTNNFLEYLKQDITLPQKTRDIYLYLPNQMMSIYSSIRLFSNINLMTGKKGVQPFFYFFDTFKEYDNFIDLGDNIEVNKIDGTLQLNGKIVSINNFVKTFYDKDNKLQVQTKVIDSQSDINLIYMANYDQFLIVDNKEYNSTYIQLFVLENYDTKLFKPVILTPLAKVYKLKV
jgi:dolichyl-diphosphooligosaccharide--protein glycosyltransferase/undecaprenyl-diphosphooligosaccharide--protein glycosyltransferase